MSTFRTVVPSSEDDVADVLARAHDPLLIGGGTLTVPALTRGDVTPSVVVDLGRAGLDRLEIQADSVCVGALVPYQQLLDSEGIRRRLPMLHGLCAGITGGIQIRNQGTIVGALCAARPQSDGPAALVALDADVLIRSHRGSRVIAARDFLRGAEKNDLGAGEFVTAIRIPFSTSGSGYVAAGSGYVAAGSGYVAAGSGYVKVKFAESSWPVLTAAAVLSGHVVIGGLADVPQRITLTHCKSEADLETVRAAVTDHVDRIPETQRWSDLRADWHYRRRVAPEIAVRAVRRALQESDHDR